MQKNSLLVIGSYPPKNNTHHKSIVGGASYTKNTLLHLKDALSQNGKEPQITVLAEKNKKSQKYTDEGIKVKRIWQKNSLLSFPKLLFEIIKKHRKTKNILIEFEFAMFGEKLSLPPLLIFMLCLRLLNKNTTFVLHQVVTDIGELNGHLNIKKKGIKTSVINFFIQSMYFMIVTLTSKVIVFDEKFKKRLSKFGMNEKVKVIPHGVEQFKNIPSIETSRKKLSIQQDSFVILAFGFLAWYKGSDWIAQAYKQIEEKNKKNIKLIIAGGPNPNHMNKDFYKKYIKNLEKTCKENNISLTGFIKEKEIPTYFQASDCVVFPYRVHMSASGPLSLALSFAKPILLSKSLQSVFETRDIREETQRLNIKKEDITFLGYRDFEQKVIKIANNKKYRQDLQKLSQTLKQKRAWDTIGIYYMFELFAPAISKKQPSKARVTQPAYEISQTTS